MQKINLVIFPLHDWKKCEKEGFRTRDAHFILEFEKSPLVEKMLIIDRPISIPEMLLKKQWWRVKSGKKISRNFDTCITQVSEKIYVLDILSFDIIRPIFMKKKWWQYIFKQRVIINEVEETIDYLKLDDFVLFLWNPMSEGVIGKLGEKLLVFDAIDNWLTHPELNYANKEIEQGYQKIKEKADLIFTVSESLKSFFENNQNNVYCISNGVDIDYFRRQEGGDIPKDIRGITKPIVGYAGKIQDRIDVDLVKFLAKKLTQVSFVFIGQVINRKTIRSLLQYKNLHYLGDKHYSLLPQYLSWFDICIIPHKVSGITLSMSPLKIYEYLASGKPVVSTNVAGVDDFKHVITIAETNEEFLLGIKKYIQVLSQENDLSEKLKKSITVDHFWSTKANKMIDMIVDSYKT